MQGGTGVRHRRDRIGRRAVDLESRALVRQGRRVAGKVGEGVSRALTAYKPDRRRSAPSRYLARSRCLVYSISRSGRGERSRNDDFDRPEQRAASACLGPEWLLGLTHEATSKGTTSSRVHSSEREAPGHPTH
jgi:hypothetical protein